MNKSRSGFTIVELLIVIVVIGILAAIAIVAYNGVQSRAKHAQLVTVSNATQKAAHMALAASGEFPRADDYSYQNSNNYVTSTCIGSLADYPATSQWIEGVCSAPGSSTKPDDYQWRARHKSATNAQIESYIGTLPSGVHATVRYNCGSVPSCGHSHYEYSRGVSYNASCSDHFQPSYCNAYVLYSLYGDHDCGAAVKSVRHDDAKRVTLCGVTIHR